MTSPAQSPLTPADCDLRDFAFMPVETDRVLKSETWIMGTGDERAAAISLWFHSWHQVPAGSLPNKDEVLAHLAICQKWKKVKAHALRGWILCSDGRLYHPVVCEKVLEAWVEKLLNSLSGNVGNAKRWGVEIDVTAIRAQLMLAIGMLRDLAPQSKTLKKKAVVSIAAGSPPDVVAPSPPDSQRDSAGDRKGQGQGQGLVNTPATATREAPAASEVFPIREGWSPSESFTVQAKLMGLPVLDPNAMAEGLSEFTAYWLARPGELRTQAEWEHALAKSLKHRSVRAVEAEARQSTAPRTQRPSATPRTPNHGGHDAVEPA